MRHPTADGENATEAGEPQLKTGMSAACQVRCDQLRFAHAAGDYSSSAGLFPVRIHFGFELAAADEFLEVADDGAAGDAEFAGEGGDVGPLAGLADDLPDPVLPAEAVGRAAEQVEGVNAVGAFEGFELPDGFMLAAFLEGGLDGAFERADVQRLGEAVVGAARPLERLAVAGALPARRRR